MNSIYRSICALLGYKLRYKLLVSTENPVMGTILTFTDVPANTERTLIGTSGPDEARDILTTTGFTPATKRQVSGFLKKNPLMQNYLFIAIDRPRVPKDKSDWHEFGDHWSLTTDGGKSWRLDYWNGGWFVSFKLWCYLGVTVR